MSENWYVVHTQPRGEKMLKALLDREPAVADTYLPMRQQFAIVGGQRVSRMALTMPGLVFVRGNKNQLVALLREKSGASRLMVDSSRKEKDAMVVADSEMTAFRLFNDNTAGQLMMLRSPFCNFTSADRIRIMSGPFAGYEGYIREIGGDNKLIFKVGSMAIALSNVMRYDVAVVENHHASTETSLQLRIADSLRARLEEAGHVDDACDCLRDIMTGAAGMPAAFTDADRADARSLAHFCASDRKRIDSIVDNAPLRRFLTPTAETGTLHRTNCKTAEMCKLTENSSRDVQIAFANELSLICDKAGINVWELIALANKHPRVNILQPGCGVGGHCIAVDPYFITADFPVESQLIAKAREINNYKAFWCAEKVENAMLRFELENHRKPTVAMMGLAFKPNIDDLRESPAKYITTKVMQSCNNADILVVEPNVTEHNVFKLTDYREAYDRADIVVFLTAHDPFKMLPRRDDKIILDFCGIYK